MVTLEWLRNKQIAVFAITGFESRQAVDDYYQQLAELIAEWPISRLYLVVHDLSKAKEVPWTPYIRRRSEHHAASFPTSFRGRVAYILPRHHSSQVFQLYVRRDRQRQVPQLLHETFFEHEHAFAWIEEALDCAFYERIGREHFVAARYDAAGDVYQTMLKVAEANEDIAQQAHALTQISDAYYMQGLYDEMPVLLDRAEALAMSLDHQLPLARIQIMRGWYLRIQRDWEQAIALGEQAYATCSALDSRQDMARALNLVGSIHQIQHRVKAAEDYYKKALSLFMATNAQTNILAMLNKLGGIASQRRQYASAVHYYHQALNKAIELGDRHAEVLSLALLGTAQVSMEDFDAAEKTLRRVSDLVQITGIKIGWMLYIYCALGIACAKQNKVDEAWEILNHAYEMAQSSQIKGQIAAVWRAFGVLAIANQGYITIDGKRHPAAYCFELSANIFSEINSQAEYATTLQWWADYETSDGDTQKAQQLQMTAYQILSELEALLDD